VNDIAKWPGVAARLVVGGVWIVAGLLKIGDPAGNVRAVRAYQLLPESLAQLVGHALPTLEIVIGVCLVLGLVTRWVALLSSLMLGAFIIGIASAWARGLEIECGCFGGGGGPAKGASGAYPWELARDAGLLLLSVYLVWRPRTPLSVDDRMLPAVPPVARNAGSTPARAGSRQQAAELRRAAAAQEQQRRNHNVTVAVLVALLAVVGVGYAIQANGDVTGQVPGRTPSGVVDRYAFPAGATDAKTVVDVYEDFMCPFCGQFEAGSRSYVDKTAGPHVLFRYHIIAFLDRSSSTQYSSRAANALGAVLDTSGPQVAKKFHDELYERQPQEGSAGLSDADLVQLAVAAGAKQSAVEQPIKDGKFAGWVRNATDAASKAGVNQTPTVLVDGQPIGGQTIGDIVAAMESAVAKDAGQ
jgi:protein-disulfide isomerase/uncharacterized membrane protein YphA (DoxX/SURF4 family)